MPLKCGCNLLTILHNWLYILLWMNVPQGDGQGTISWPIYLPCWLLLLGSSLMATPTYLASLRAQGTKISSKWFFVATLYIIYFTYIIYIVAATLQIVKIEFTQSMDTNCFHWHLCE